MARIIIKDIPINRDLTIEELQEIFGRGRYRPTFENLEERQLLAVGIVDSLADAGAGSLRQAILDANANPGDDIIQFDIDGEAPHTIQPLSDLPEIVDTIFLDATTQPGYDGEPLIILDGNFIDGESTGLVLGEGSDGSDIRGLVVSNFANDVLVESADVNVDVVTYADLAQLQQQNGFYSDGDYYLNYSGYDEKWFYDQNDNWYALTPNGALRRWNSGDLLNEQANPIVATVDPAVYDDLELLFTAGQQQTGGNDEQTFADLAQLQQQYGFYSDGDYFLNWGGYDDKWFHDQNDNWYALTPDGTLRRWNSGDLLNEQANPIIAEVDPAVYDDPDLLFDAGQQQTGGGEQETYADLAQLQQQYGFYSDGDYFLNWGGYDDKWFYDQNDNWYALTPDGTLRRWNSGDLLNEQANPIIAAVDPAVYDDPDLLFTAGQQQTGGNDEQTFADLAQLQQQYGFYSGGDFYLNYSGYDEKWFYDRNDNWYALTPDGTLRHWESGDLMDSVVVANIDPAVYDNPNLLFGAVAQDETGQTSEQSQLVPIETYLSKFGAVELTENADENGYHGQLVIPLGTAGDGVTLDISVIIQDGQAHIVASGERSDLTLGEDRQLFWVENISFTFERTIPLEGEIEPGGKMTVQVPKIIVLATDIEEGTPQSGLLEADNLVGYLDEDGNFHLEVGEVDFSLGTQLGAKATGIQSNDESVPSVPAMALDINLSEGLSSFSATVRNLQINVSESFWPGFPPISVDQIDISSSGFRIENATFGGRDIGVALGDFLSADGIVGSFDVAVNFGDGWNVDTQFRFAIGTATLFPGRGGDSLQARMIGLRGMIDPDEQAVTLDAAYVGLQVGDTMHLSANAVRFQYSPNMAHGSALAIMQNVAARFPKYPDFPTSTIEYVILRNNGFDIHAPKLINIRELQAEVADETDGVVGIPGDTGSGSDTPDSGGGDAPPDGGGSDEPFGGGNSGDEPDGPPDNPDDPTPHPDPVPDEDDEIVEPPPEQPVAPAALKFKHFRHASATDVAHLSLSYEVTQTGDEMPVTIWGYGEDEYHGDFAEAITQLTISPEEIENNPALALKNEAPSQALALGTHELLIDPTLLPDFALKEAMENPEIEILQAGDKSSNTSLESGIAFQGFYQADTSQRAVIRTGPRTEDKVDIDNAEQPQAGLVLRFEAKASETAVINYETTIAAAPDILVVTADKDDRTWVEDVVTTSTYVMAGAGDDWVITGSGDDTVFAGKGRDVVLGEGFGPTAGYDGPSSLDEWKEAFRSGSKLHLEANLGPIGSGSDKIYGEDGFDILVGGAGSDEIDGGDDGSLIFADYLLSTGASLDVNWGGFPEITSFDKAKEFLDDLLKIKVKVDAHFGMPGDGSDTNTLKGGDGVDIIFGSKGNDEISTGSGPVDVAFGFDGQDQIDGQQSDYTLLFGGDKNDKLFGSDSGRNLMVGGDGNDQLDGGDDLDVIIGDSFGITLNEEADLVDGAAKFFNDLWDKKITFVPGIGGEHIGDDVITGGGGFDVLIGGGGRDIIDGGEGDGIIFGDSFGVSIGTTVNFSDLNLGDVDVIDVLTNPVGVVGDAAANLAKQLFGDTLDAGLRQSGKDDITGSKGTDLIFGGDDQDVITPGVDSALDVIFGGKGNDTIDASDADVIVAFGEEGDDTMYAARRGSFMTGGADNDKLFGAGQGVNVLVGDNFDINLNDSNFLKGIGDLLSGLIDRKVSIKTEFVLGSGAGSDTIVGGSNLDLLVGGGGADLIKGMTGFNVIIGDAISFSAGAEDLSFDELSDENTGLLKKAFKLIGDPELAVTGSGADTILGGDSFDLIHGAGGNDKIATGGGPADLVFGGDDDDSIGGVDEEKTTNEDDPVIGFSKTDVPVVFGGKGDDEIWGGRIASFLFGGDDNDTLRGGDAFDFLAGDDYELTLNNTGFIDGVVDFIEKLKEGKLFLRMRLTAKGTGDDLLIGGDGFDWLIGGDGSDTLEGGKGGGILFGDAFNMHMGPEVDIKKVLKDLKGGKDDSSSTGSGGTGSSGSGSDGNDNTTTGNETEDDKKKKKKKKGKSLWQIVYELVGPEFTLTGTGNDLVVGGEDTELLVGGDGNDTLKGVGGYFDALTGNEGDDILTAAETDFVVMIGGDDNDQLTANPSAEAYGGLLMGDSYDFKGIPINLASLVSIDLDGKIPKHLGLQTGFLQSGTGQDVIHGAGGGLNFMIGGDGHDYIKGGGYIDIAFGDSLNIGGELSLSFPGLSKEKKWWENVIGILDTELNAQFPGLDGEGNDCIHGGNGFLLALGGAGDDHIVGSTGDRDGENYFVDILLGNRGNDKILADAKILDTDPDLTTAKTSRGYHLMIGGSGDDIMVGSNQNDGGVFDAYESVNIYYGDALVPDLNEVEAWDDFLELLADSVIEENSLFSSPIEGDNLHGEDIWTNGDGFDHFFAEEDNDTEITFDEIVGYDLTGPCDDQAYQPIPTDNDTSGGSNVDVPPEAIDNLTEAGKPKRPLLILHDLAGSFFRKDFTEGDITPSQWFTTLGVKPWELEADPLTHAYDNLLDTLDKAGYTPNQDLFMANYDWRLPLAPEDGTPDGVIAGITQSQLTDSTFNHGLDYLGHWIEKAVTAWQNDPENDGPPESIDIIAHGAGGIVARAYIQSSAYGNGLPTVENFVMAGVPNQGVSAAFSALQDSWGSSPTYKLILSKIVHLAMKKLEDDGTIQRPSQAPITKSDVFIGGEPNYPKLIEMYLPSLKSLLPTYNYFNSAEVSEQMSQLLLDLNKGFTIDGNNLNDPNAFADQVGHTYVIAGTSAATPFRVKQENFESSGFLQSLFGTDKPEVFRAKDSGEGSKVDEGIWYKDIILNLGDGIVPYRSATEQFLGNDKISVFDVADANGEHGNLIAGRHAQQWVLNVLNIPASEITADKYQPVTKSHAKLINDPIHAFYVDAQGRRLGYSESTGVLTEIPGSVYIGEADGIGYIFGEIDGPLELEVTGLGGDYYIQTGVNTGSQAGGQDFSGTLAAGATETFEIPLFDIYQKYGIAGLIELDDFTLGIHHFSFTVDETGDASVKGGIQISAAEAALLPDVETKELDGFVTVEGFTGYIDIASGGLVVGADKASVEIDGLFSAEASSTGTKGAPGYQPGIAFSYDPTGSLPEHLQLLNDEGEQLLFALNNLDLDIPALEDFGLGSINLDKLEIEPDGGFHIKDKINLPQNITWSAGGVDLLELEGLEIEFDIDAEFTQSGDSLLPVPMIAGSLEVSSAGISVFPDSSYSASAAGLYGKMEFGTESLPSLQLSVDQLTVNLGPTSATLTNPKLHLTEGAGTAETPPRLFTADAASLEMFGYTMTVTNFELFRELDANNIPKFRFAEASLSATEGFAGTLGLGEFLPIDLYELKLKPSWEQPNVPGLFELTATAKFNYQMLDDLFPFTPTIALNGNEITSNDDPDNAFSVVLLLDDNGMRFKAMHDAAEQVIDSISVGFQGWEFGQLAFDGELTIADLTGMASGGLPTIGGMIRLASSGENFEVLGADVDLNGFAAGFVASAAVEGDTSVLTLTAGLALDFEIQFGSLLQLEDLAGVFELKIANPLNGDFSPTFTPTLNSIHVGRLTASVGDLFRLSAEEVDINVMPDLSPGAPPVEEQTLVQLDVTASLPSLGIGGQIKDLTILRNGMPDFDQISELWFTFNEPVDDSEIAATGDSTGGMLSDVLDYLPVRLDKIGFKFHQPSDEGGPNSGFYQYDNGDLIGVDPSRMSLVLYGGVQAPEGWGEYWPIHGTVRGMEVNLKKLVDGEFPIENLESVSVGIDPLEVSAMTIGGNLTFGLVKDAEGEVVYITYGTGGIQVVDMEAGDLPLAAVPMIYARIMGQFEYDGLGANLDLVLTPAGPVLATIGAGVPIPLGKSGLMLTNVSGGINFGGVVIDTPDDPVDLVTDARYYDPLSINEDNIRQAVMNVIETGLPTFAQPLTVAISATISTDIPGLISGDVELAFNVNPQEIVQGVQEAVSDGIEELSTGLRIFGNGQINVFGMPVGRAGILLDLSKIDPEMQIAIQAPTEDGLLKFLFPVQTTATLKYKTDGVYTAPLVGLRTFMSSLSNDAKDALFNQLADYLNDHPERPLAKLLTGDADSMTFTGVSLQEGLLTGADALMPASFDAIRTMINSGPEQAEKVGDLFTALMQELPAILGQHPEQTNKPDLFQFDWQELMAGMAGSAVTAIQEGSEAFWEVFDPSLEIRASTQPQLLGFPIGSEVYGQFTIDKNGARLVAEGSLLSQLKMYPVLGQALLATPLGWMEDQLTFDFRKHFQNPVEFLQLLFDTASANDSSELSEASAALASYMVEALNPYAGWEGEISGGFDAFGYHLADVSGIVFESPLKHDGTTATIKDNHMVIGRVRLVTPQEELDAALPQFIADGRAPANLAQLIAEHNLHILPENVIEDGTIEESFLEAGTHILDDGSYIKVTDVESFVNMLDYGGVLMDGQLQVPQWLIDPFAFYEQVDKQKWIEPEDGPGEWVTGKWFDALEHEHGYDSDRNGWLPPNVSAERIGQIQTNANDGALDVAAQQVMDLVSEITTYKDHVLKAFQQIDDAAVLQFYMPSPMNLIDPVRLEEEFSKPGQQDSSLTGEDENLLTELFDAAYLTGDADMTLLGVNWGEGHIEATVEGLEYSATMPYMGVEQTVKLSSREVSLKQFVEDLFSNAQIAGQEGISTNFADLQASLAELTGLLDGQQDLVSNVSESMPAFDIDQLQFLDTVINMPVGGYQFEIGSENANEWSNDEFSDPANVGEEVFDNLLGLPASWIPTDLANLSAEMYTPGYAEPVDGQPRGIEHDGGFRFAAQTNIPSLFDAALKYEVQMPQGLDLPHFKAHTHFSPTAGNPLDQLNLPGLPLLAGVNAFEPIGLSQFDVTIERNADGLFADLAGRVNFLAAAGTFDADLEITSQGIVGRALVTFDDAEALSFPGLFEIDGNVYMHINTTGADVVQDGITYKAGASLHVDGMLTLPGVEISGSFDFIASQNGIALSMDGSTTLFGQTIQPKGSLTITQAPTNSTLPFVVDGSLGITLTELVLPEVAPGVTMKVGSSGSAAVQFSLSDSEQAVSLSFTDFDLSVPGLYDTVKVSGQFSYDAVTQTYSGSVSGTAVDVNLLTVKSGVLLSGQFAISGTFSTIDPTQNALSFEATGASLSLAALNQSSGITLLEVGSVQIDSTGTIHIDVKDPDPILFGANNEVMVDLPGFTIDYTPPQKITSPSSGGFGFFFAAPTAPRLNISISGATVKSPVLGEQTFGGRTIYVENDGHLRLPLFNNDLQLGQFEVAGRVELRTTATGAELAFLNSGGNNPRFTIDDPLSSNTSDKLVDIEFTPFVIKSNGNIGGVNGNLIGGTLHRLGNDLVGVQEASVQLLTNENGLAFKFNQGKLVVHNPFTSDTSDRLIDLPLASDFRIDQDGNLTSTKKALWRSGGSGYYAFGGALDSFGMDMLTFVDSWFVLQMDQESGLNLRLQGQRFTIDDPLSSDKLVDFSVSPIVLGSDGSIGGIDGSDTVSVAVNKFGNDFLNVSDVTASLRLDLQQGMHFDVGGGRLTVDNPFSTQKGASLVTTALSPFKIGADGIFRLSNGETQLGTEDMFGQGWVSLTDLGVSLTLDETKGIIATLEGGRIDIEDPLNSSYKLLDIEFDSIAIGADGSITDIDGGTINGAVNQFGHSNLGIQEASAELVFNDALNAMFLKVDGGRLVVADPTSFSDAKLVDFSLPSIYVHANGILTNTVMQTTGPIAGTPVGVISTSSSSGSGFSVAAAAPATSSGSFAAASQSSLSASAATPAASSGSLAAASQSSLAASTQSAAFAVGASSHFSSTLGTLGQFGRGWLDLDDLGVRLALSSTQGLLLALDGGQITIDDPTSSDPQDKLVDITLDPIVLGATGTVGGPNGDSATATVNQLGHNKFGIRDATIELQIDFAKKDFHLKVGSGRVVIGAPWSNEPDAALLDEQIVAPILIHFDGEITGDQKGPYSLIGADDYNALGGPPSSGADLVPTFDINSIGEGLLKLTSLDMYGFKLNPQSGFSMTLSGGKFQLLPALGSSEHLIDISFEPIVIGGNGSITNEAGGAVVGTVHQLGTNYLGIQDATAALKFDPKDGLLLKLDGGQLNLPFLDPIDLSNYSFSITSSGAAFTEFFATKFNFNPFVFEIVDNSTYGMITIIDRSLRFGLKDGQVFDLGFIGHSMTVDELTADTKGNLSAHLQKLGNDWLSVQDAAISLQISAKAGLPLSLQVQGGKLHLPVGEPIDLPTVWLDTQGFGWIPKFNLGQLVSEYTATDNGLFRFQFLDDGAIEFELEEGESFTLEVFGNSLTVNSFSAATNGDISASLTGTFALPAIDTKVYTIAQATFQLARNGEGLTLDLSAGDLSDPGLPGGIGSITVNGHFTSTSDFSFSGTYDPDWAGGKEFTVLIDNDSSLSVSGDLLGMGSNTYTLQADGKLTAFIGGNTRYFLMTGDRIGVDFVLEPIYTISNLMGNSVGYLIESFFDPAANLFGEFVQFLGSLTDPDKGEEFIDAVLAAFGWKIW